MKVKITITANIKAPEVGDAYGGYGLAGRAGYWEEPIRAVRKQYIVVAGKMINIKEYAFHKAFNKTNKKIKVEVLKWKKRKKNQQ